MITLTRYKSFKLNIFINSNPKPKQMNNTKAICDAMSLLSSLDEVKRDYKGKTVNKLIIDLVPTIQAIEDKDIREHFVTLILLRF